MTISNSPNMGFLKWLSLILITLKLCNIVDCSWFITILPLIISIALTSISKTMIDKAKQITEEQNKLNQ